MDCRTNYKSSYLVNQQPQRFGGKQEDYIERANQVIQSAAKKIRAGKERGEDLKKLFFEVIEYLSCQRGLIAKDHKPGSEKTYGIRRDAYLPGCTSTVGLTGVYEKYGSQLINCFSKYLCEMETDGTFRKEHLIKDVCQGRTTTLCIQVLSVSEMEKKGYFATPQSYLPTYISSEKVDQLDNETYSTEEIVKYREMFRQFKVESPDKYHQKRVASLVWEVNKTFPSPAFLKVPSHVVLNEWPKAESYQVIGNMKSIYVYAELRTNVAGKLYKITEYMTWMYENGDWLNHKDPASHPIQRLKERSKIMLLHQDEFLITPTLEEISKLFESAINWNRKTHSLQDLKDLMTPLFFLATHNIRNVNGVAAENEWLEHAIYEFLDVDMARPEDRLLDLEAFTNPILSDFKKAYNEMTNLRLV